MTDAPLEEIVVKTAAEVPIEDLIRLYKDAGWWKDAYEKDHDFLHAIAGNSSLFVGAFSKKKLIGMGRALSDMASDAYIQDVVVLKSYRKRGIGGKIIRLLVKKLRQKGVDWIGLVAQPGTTAFYNDLGFAPLKGHTALKYEDKP